MEKLFFQFNDIIDILLLSFSLFIAYQPTGINFYYERINSPPVHKSLTINSYICPHGKSEFY